MDILIPVLTVTVIGLIVGIGLSLASKYMSVPVDEKQEKVRECLPGANCGACGYSGCDGYAAAVAAGEVAPDKCAPGGAAATKSLAEVLGVEVSLEPKTAFIACGAYKGKSKAKYNYQGMPSCAAANLVQGGPLECDHGCLGFGDCYRACPFDAIKMTETGPIVCEDICTGCGVCAKSCPRSVISVIPKGSVRVLCSNKAKGAVAAKDCGISCIVCRLCEKNCPNEAVKIVDNLAVIDYLKCDSCGKCKELCKRGVII